MSETCVHCGEPIRPAGPGDNAGEHEWVHADTGSPLCKDLGVLRTRVV